MTTTPPQPSATDTGERVQAVDEHGERVQHMFSDIAHGYDRANRIMSLGTDVRWRRQAVSDLLPPALAAAAQAAGRRARLLDLCAGTLDSTIEIHRRFPEADLIAGDFSIGMLETGRAKLRGSAAERITTRDMDAHSLPEDDRNLDGIFCAFGVRNLSEVERATAEMARCLRPGGRLTVLEFFRPEGLVTRVVHTLHNRTVLPLVGWASTGNLGAYRYLPRSIGEFLSVADYRALLERHGFVDVTCTRLTLGIASIVRATRGPTEAA